MKIAIWLLLVIAVLSALTICIMFKAGVEHGKKEAMDYAIQCVNQKSDNIIEDFEAKFGKGYKSEVKR